LTAAATVSGYGSTSDFWDGQSTDLHFHQDLLDSAKERESTWTEELPSAIGAGLFGPIVLLNDGWQPYWQAYWTDSSTVGRVGLVVGWIGLLCCLFKSVID
jgi:hypothetical protein